MQIMLRRLYSSTAKVARNGPFRRLRQRGDGIQGARTALASDILGSQVETTFIQPHHPVATTILNEPTIVIERQLEMMNVFLGFEQANKYAIMDVLGNRIGYMQERDFSIGKAILRQIYKLHRPFTVDVFDNWGNVIMTIRRPFSWINSHIKAFLPPITTVEQDYVKQSSTLEKEVHSSSPFGNVPQPQYIDDSQGEGILVGESIQNWHLWRRRYELFQRDLGSEGSFSEYGQIDAPFLSFEFPVMDANGKIMAGVDRNWVGLGREFFTDTGVYVIRFDSKQSFENVYPPDLLSDSVLDLDQRAVLLANAVSIDYDYFSRHSRHSGGLLSFGSYDE
ncbi:Aim25p TDEL_0C03350 [Torulaspora delbrueckii]|uniref:Phospholipid scramblase n=1 Tax=Torulaspora delbrueckii TaxID=4950 RepID=G8ZRT2_TORDE|nr:hypothetical protein TDEL_0C03350 [Torulaspora delbrueckii]CCE91224.1 hypothetical protein TDEL_0C03350 [Torulaspora delbrueckii]